MSDPSTLPHDKLAFFGCLLPRFQFWQCLSKSYEPRFHLCYLDKIKRHIYVMYYTHFMLSNHGLIFNKCFRLYWLDLCWEPLSLKYLPPGALGTACPSVVMRVSQWVRDKVLARTAILHRSPSLSALLCLIVYLIMQCNKKYSQFKGGSRNLGFFSLFQRPP